MSACVHERSVGDVPGVERRLESDAGPRTFNAALSSFVVILKSEEPAPVLGEERDNSICVPGRNLVTTLWEGGNGGELKTRRPRKERDLRQIPVDVSTAVLPVQAGRCPHRAGQETPHASPQSDCTPPCARALGIAARPTPLVCSFYLANLLRGYFPNVSDVFIWGSAITGDGSRVFSKLGH